MPKFDPEDAKSITVIEFITEVRTFCLEMDVLQLLLFVTTKTNPSAVTAVRYDPNGERFCASRTGSKLCLLVLNLSFLLAFCVWITIVAFDSATIYDISSNTELIILTVDSFVYPCLKMLIIVKNWLNAKQILDILNCMLRLDREMQLLLSYRPNVLWIKVSCQKMICLSTMYYIGSQIFFCLSYNTNKWIRCCFSSIFSVIGIIGSFYVVLLITLNLIILNANEYLTILLRISLERVCVLSEKRKHHDVMVNAIKCNDQIRKIMSKCSEYFGIPLLFLTATIIVEGVAQLFLLHESIVEQTFCFNFDFKSIGRISWIGGEIITVIALVTVIGKTSNKVCDAILLECLFRTSKVKTPFLCSTFKVLIQLSICHKILKFFTLFY